jgi:hypothetical protein
MGSNLAPFRTLIIASLLLYTWTVALHEPCMHVYLKFRTIISFDSQSLSMFQGLIIYNRLLTIDGQIEAIACA